MIMRVSVGLCAFVGACARSCVFVGVCGRLWAFVGVCVHLCAFVCMCVCVHLCVCVCLCLCLCVCLCVFVCVCLCFGRRVNSQTHGCCLEPGKAASNHPNADVNDSLRTAAVVEAHKLLRRVLGMGKLGETRQALNTKKNQPNQPKVKELPRTFVGHGFPHPLLPHF